MRKLEEGACIDCGQPRQQLSKRYCQICLKKHKESSRKERIALRQRLINAYGGKCACCEETETLFLSLDHINNDGYKEQYSGYRLYRKVLRDGCPPIYRLLCHNCNLGRAMNGGVCPHATN